MVHPATGPISPEEMHRLAALPYGKAQEELRKHDPLFGVKNGEKIKWTVKVTSQAQMVAYTTVEAESEAEAEAIVSARNPNSFDWDCWDTADFDIESVDPA